MPARGHTVFVGIVVAAAASVMSACGGSAHATAAPPTAPPARCASLPAWRSLARRERIDVYCPSWLPNPLSASFAASSYAGTFFGAGRAYLVSYLESDPVGSQNTEVHVNLRGYPHATRIPTCDNSSAPGAAPVPCFDDGFATKRLAGKRITVYTVNQGADKWHVAYVWRHAGSLYVASEHVITPYPFSSVVRNLDHVVRGLVVVHG